MTYDEDRASSMVLKLWHHTDEDLRMEFVRHPVDEVRSLEAEVERRNDDLEELRADVERLREENERLRRIEEAARKHAQHCLEGNVQYLEAALEEK